MPIKDLDAHPELRDDPSLKDFNDVVTLAKSFKDTKAFVGSSIRPPGPDASAEAKAEFYKKLQTHAPHLVPLDDKDEAAQKLVWGKLGRPEKPEEYTAEVPQDVSVDLEGLRAVAVETGMTKSQFQKAVNKAIETAKKNADSALADAKALRSEWGAAYEDKLGEAASAAAKAGAPEAFVKRVKEGKLPSDQLKLWAGMHKALGGETTVIGKQTPNRATLTVAEAQAQIDEIRANPMFMDRSKRDDPARQRMLERMVELQKFVTPE